MRQLCCCCARCVHYYNTAALGVHARLYTCCSSFTPHWRRAALSVPKHIQTDQHDTHTGKCMHISITHTHTQTHTQAQAQAQARIGHTCNASLTQTQARTRTHAREPRTRTPARGRSATAACPRRRLHPALPRQLAGTAALHHPPSPNFYWRFFDANPLLCSPRKPLLPGIASYGGSRTRRTSVF